MRIYAGVFVGLVAVSSLADAQGKRRPLDGSTAFRISGGLGMPIGNERLARAWSSGGALSVSGERYLTDRTTKSEVSLGVLYRYSAHAFDAPGFVHDFRPNGDTALTATGAGATLHTIAAVGRISMPHGRWSNNVMVNLGPFFSSRPDVTYTSTAGTKVFRMDNKFGFEFGAGLGFDFELGPANAISLEAGLSIGASNRDDIEGSGAITCNSSGCGVQHERTQVISLRAGFRRIVRPRD